MSDQRPRADDQALIADALRGDEDALGQVLSRDQEWAYNVAYRVVGHEADARDAVQDAFLLTVRALRGDGSPPHTSDSFRPWLRRVVVNSALTQIRRRPAVRPVSVDDVAESLPAPDRGEPGRSTEDEQTRRQVLQVLLSLPQTQRAALALKEYLNASYEEIAQTLGIPRTAVGTLLFRARTAFRESFDRVPDLASPIDCPDLVPLFSTIVDEEPPPAAWNVLEHHLNDCDRCQDTLQGQRRARRLYALVPLAALPAGWEPVRAAFESAAAAAAAHGAATGAHGVTASGATGAGADLTTGGAAGQIAPAGAAQASGQAATTGGGAQAAASAAPASVPPPGIDTAGATLASHAAGASAAPAAGASAAPLAGAPAAGVPVAAAPLAGAPLASAPLAAAPAAGASAAAVGGGGLLAGASAVKLTVAALAAAGVIGAAVVAAPFASPGPDPSVSPAPSPALVASPAASPAPAVAVGSPSPAPADAAAPNPAIGAMLFPSANPSPTAILTPVAPSTNLAPSPPVAPSTNLAPGPPGRTSRVARAIAGRLSARSERPRARTSSALIQSLAGLNANQTPPIPRFPVPVGALRMTKVGSCSPLPPQRGRGWGRGLARSGGGVGGGGRSGDRASTNFRMRLTKAESPAAATHLERGTSIWDKVLSATSTSPFVLVVEDDPTICEVIELILAEEGYAVSSIGDPSAALALIQARQPDLILLDLSLPGDGGEGFIAAYRRLPGATASIVIMSGLANVEQRARALGADGSIAKPFEIDTLLDTIRGLLVTCSVTADTMPSSVSRSVRDDQPRVMCRGR